MSKLSSFKKQVISPVEHSVRLEFAMNCDGSICHMGIYDNDEHGELTDIQPHFHLVECELGVRTTCCAMTVNDELLVDLYQREARA
jgi:hypothetical protein